MKNAFRAIALIGVLFAANFISGEGGETAKNQQSTYQYSPPVDTGDGWVTAHLSEVGLNSAPLSELISRIRNENYPNIHSVLIVKDGKLAFEEYFPGIDRRGREIDYDHETLHELHSVTKSVNSLLIGIAIDQGYISGVDAKALDFFPEYEDLASDSAKGEISLRDLLVMRSGLKWDESTYPYTDSRNDHSAMNKSTNQVHFVLSRPLVGEPGDQSSYNSGVSIVIGDILRKATGLHADDFAQKNLFEPLGITNYGWQRYASGAVQTGGGLRLRPRDMAKIGQLFLNEGMWRKERIVSKEWILDSKQYNREWKADFPRSTGYGYQWWLTNRIESGQVVPIVSANGRGGQYIFIMPSLQMVAVFTGWNDNRFQDIPKDLLERYVIHAALAE